MSLPVWAKAYLLYLCRAPDIAAVVALVDIFSYDAVLGRDSNLSPSRQRVDALHVNQQRSLGQIYRKIYSYSLFIVLGHFSLILHCNTNFISFFVTS